MNKISFVSEKERFIFIKQTQIAISNIIRFNNKHPQYADTNKLKRQQNFLKNCINNYQTN